MQNLNGLQRIFLILFIVSTVIVLMLAVNQNTGTVSPSATNDPSIIATPGEDNPEDHQPSSVESNQNSSALIGSTLASATSLIGFVMTTVITWRKEKRESAIADVERQKLETELEKSKLELEKLKKKKSPKKKTKK